MGKNQKKVTVIIISLIVISLFLSIYITVEERMPGIAVVIVTLEDKYYHSIYFDYSCIAEKAAQTMTLSEAISQGYIPHPLCRDLGYFRGNRRFLFHHTLSKLGMRVNTRWDNYGNWLW